MTEPALPRSSAVLHIGGSDSEIVVGDVGGDAVVVVPGGSATDSSVPDTSLPPPVAESVLVRPRFVEGSAPEWPFSGVVQLWANSSGTALEEGGVVWWLRYWSEGLDARALPMVPLGGLEVKCLGGVGLVSHGERGIEVGGPVGAVSGSFLVRWGEGARRLEGPSEELLVEIDERPSTIEAGSAG